MCNTTSLSNTATETMKVPISSFTGDSGMLNVTPTSSEDPDAWPSSRFSGANLNFKPHHRSIRARPYLTGRPVDSGMSSSDQDLALK